MFPMWSAIALLSVLLSAHSFPSVITQAQRPHRLSSFFSSASNTGRSSGSEQEIDLGLTPELRKVTDAFASIPDEQVRYKQLLYMAQNTKEVQSFPEASKILENKVPGCLSTVYVDGTAEYSEEVGDYVINFVGDSDGLLTKGLVALLCRCLSGNTAETIQKVDPKFIKAAKIEQSLTPGRNNGFLNMLKKMKEKALVLDVEARSGAAPLRNDVASTSPHSDPEDKDNMTSSNSAAYAERLGPKYSAIVQALQVLKPTKLELVDNSHQHAGHAGNDIDGESHFDLTIVASAFDGLNLVKRHQLIYMVLGEIMPKIHALRIQSLTPEEVEQRGLT